MFQAREFRFAIEGGFSSPNTTRQKLDNNGCKLTLPDEAARMAQTRRMGKATRKGEAIQSAEVFALPS
jgi:hypothetical protein